LTDLFDSTGVRILKTFIKSREAKSHSLQIGVEEKKLTKRLNHTIAILTLLFFVASGANVYPQQISPVSESVTGAHAKDGMRSVQQTLPDTRAAQIRPELNPYLIAIPEAEGTIEEIFQGTQDGLIVHIQNVHANYEAETHIKNILDHLARHHGFSLIQLEGAVSKLDPGILKPTHVKDANLKLVDLLMREGRVTGADAFAVETDLPVELYGIEDEALYMENVRMFRSIYAHSEEVNSFFSEARRAIDKISRKLLAPEPLDFTRKKEAFDSDKIDLLDYLTYLAETAKTNGWVSVADLRELTEYPNLVRLMRLHELEQKMDANQLKAEAEALKSEFAKRMPDSDRAAEILSRLDEREKGESPRNYYRELTKLSEEVKIDYIGYPQIRLSAEYLIYQDEIDRHGLFRELKRYEKYMESNLFKTEEEKDLVEIISFTNLLEQYFHLEMSREQIALYLADRENIKATWIEIHVRSLSEKAGVPTAALGNAAGLDAYMADLQYFYELVLKRDQIFLDKVRARMKELGQDKTIVVTGGFHKSALAEQYRNAGLSYVVVSPNVDVTEGSENYLKVMLDEDAVVGSVFAGTFAVAVQNFLTQAFLSPVSLSRLVQFDAAAAALAQAGQPLPPSQFISLVNQALAAQSALVGNRITVQATAVREAGQLTVVNLNAGARAEGREFRFNVEASVNRVTGGFEVRLAPEGVIRQINEFANRLSETTPVEPRLEVLPLAQAIPIEFELLPAPTPVPVVVTPQEAANQGAVLDEFVPLVPRGGFVGVGEETRNAVEALLEAQEAGRPARRLFAAMREGKPIGEAELNRGTGEPINLARAREAGLSEELIAALEFFDPATYTGPKQLLVSVVDPEAPESSREEVIAIYQRVIRSDALAAVIYGVPIETVADWLDVRPDELRMGTGALGRIQVINEIERGGEPILTLSDAVERAEKDLVFGALLNFFRAAVHYEGALTPQQFLDRNAAISHGSDQVSERFGERLRAGARGIVSLQRIDPSLDALRSDEELRRAVSFFEGEILPLLRDADIALINRLFPDALVNKGGVWQVSNTSQALAFVESIYRAYRQVAGAA